MQRTSAGSAFGHEGRKPTARRRPAPPGWRRKPGSRNGPHRPVPRPTRAALASLGPLCGLGYAAGVRLAYHVMSSPVGLLFLARTERGLRFVEFLERKSLKRAFAAHAAACPTRSGSPRCSSSSRWWTSSTPTSAGTRPASTWALDVVGSDFQLKVWRALCRIPYGETRTYGQIAKAIGRPGAARAVGLANNQNPVVIIIPCHRVIGADGSLTGYGGGLPRKRKLLELEARFARPVGRTGNLFPAH